MAFQAQDAGGLEQIGVVGSAVNVVATKTSDAVRVHQAGCEIVALHAILVRGAVGKVGEGSLAEFVFFQLPDILERRAGLEAYRPIVIPAIHRIL